MKHLLICATKKKVRLEAAGEPPAYYPQGVALAVVAVVGCKMMDKSHEHEAHCELYPRARAWILDNIRLIEKPFPVKGQLGIFDVDITDHLDAINGASLVYTIKAGRRI